MKPNPKLYRELSEPFPDLAAAETAVDAFMGELAELRKKHRLRDVVVIIEVDVIAEDYLTQRLFSMSFGDAKNKLPMVARVFGAARAEHDAMIAMASGKRA